VIVTKYTYLGVGSKEVVEIFLVLSENNLLPTASIVDVCCFLQLACENPQFHTYKIIPRTLHAQGMEEGKRQRYLAPSCQYGNGVFRVHHRDEKNDASYSIIYMSKNMNRT